MKSSVKLAFIAAIFMFFVPRCLSALDLSRYQAYMSNYQDKSADNPRAQAVSRAENTHNGENLSVDADAYYVKSSPTEYVQLGSGARRDGEHYLLPPEASVPNELRPLLTERKTPRQGLANCGGSGAFLVPSPGVLEPNKTALGVHIQPFKLYNVNGTRYNDDDYFDTNVNLAFGAEEGIEFGFDKQFGNQDRFDIPEPFYFNFKYQTVKNLTLGGSFCDSTQGYSSVWVGAGIPAIWVGAGANFGPSDYKYSIKGQHKLKRARYGGYNFDSQTGEGHADPVFFMVGGALPLNDHFRFMYDFNGDKFSLGFRFDYHSMAFIDAAFVSNGDYENMPEEVSHKKSSNFIFGGSVVW